MVSWHAPPLYHRVGEYHRRMRQASPLQHSGQLGNLTQCDCTAWVSWVSCTTWGNWVIRLGEFRQLGHS
eukprot:2107558-Pyramimonas_sp.AAC.1